jgi:hypothetical protein
MRRRKEDGAARPECLIGRLAVSYPQCHSVTHPADVSGRREDHGRLVSGRAALADQQQPGTGETQYHARSPVLAVQFRAQHLDSEVAGARRVGDHQDVGDCDAAAKRAFRRLLLDDDLPAVHPNVSSSAFSVLDCERHQSESGW